MTKSYFGTCCVPHCQNPRGTKYTPYCRAHNEKHKRNGHAEQDQLPVATVDRYTRNVQRIRQEYPEFRWSVVDERFHDLVMKCEPVVAAQRAGRLQPRHWVEAAQMLIDARGQVEPRKVTDTVLAVYLFREENQHFFRTEEAFRFALVKHVMRQVLPRKEWRGARGQKRVKIKYPTLRVTRMLGEWIAAQMGAAAEAVATLRKRRLTRSDQLKADYQGFVREVLKAAERPVEKLDTSAGNRGLPYVAREATDVD